MPEGAEVKTNTDQLRALIMGRSLTGLRLVSGKLARKGLGGTWWKLGGASMECNFTFNAVLVVGVWCAGKMIIIDLNDSTRITSTLGMSGWWYPVEPPPIYDVAYVAGRGSVPSYQIHEQELKHTRVILEIDGKPTAAYCDMRNFGNLSWWLPGDIQQPMKKIGMDLLAASDHLNTPMWEHQLRHLYDHVRTYCRDSKRYARMPIAELLLCQELIAGLGNIYRAETLYLSKRHPLTRFNDLTEQEAKRLLTNACIVLNIAYFTKGRMYYPAELLIENGFHGASSVLGRTLVYGQHMTPFGEPVGKTEVGGRTLWHLEGKVCIPQPVQVVTEYKL